MKRFTYDDIEGATFQFKHHDLTFFAEPACRDEYDDHDWILGLRYYQWNSDKSRSLALCLFKREYGVSWVRTGE
jgi:hypothetical protein